MAPALQMIWALFHDPRGAKSVAERWPDAEVYSAEPPETLIGLHAQERTRIGVAAFIGGLVGALIGGGLAAYAFWRMSLEVGGMPRWPMAPIGIVIFAFTMLEAIAAVVIVLFVKGRMIGVRLRVPEEMRRKMVGGAVATMVRVRSEERDQIARELAAAGAEVQVIEVK